MCHRRLRMPCLTVALVNQNQSMTKPIQSPENLFSEASKSEQKTLLQLYNSDLNQI